MISWNFIALHNEKCKQDFVNSRIRKFCSFFWVHVYFFDILNDSKFDILTSLKKLKYLLLASSLSAFVSQRPQFHWEIPVEQINSSVEGFILQELWPNLFSFIRITNRPWLKNKKRSRKISFSLKKVINKNDKR
jgi:hypothetical protein